mgnify:CR=1 FL=1
MVGKYSVEGGHTFYNTWHVDAGMLESAYVRAVGTKLKLYTEMKLKLDSTDPTSEVRRRWSERDVFAVPYLC